MGSWQITIAGVTLGDTPPPPLTELETKAAAWGVEALPDGFTRADVTRSNGTASQASSFAATDIPGGPLGAAPAAGE